MSHVGGAISSIGIVSAIGLVEFSLVETSSFIHVNPDTIIGHLCIQILKPLTPDCCRLLSKPVHEDGLIGPYFKFYRLIVKS